MVRGLVIIANAASLTSSRLFGRWDFEIGGIPFSNLLDGVCLGARAITVISHEEFVDVFKITFHNMALCNFVIDGNDGMPLAVKRCDGRFNLIGLDHVVYDRIQGTFIGCRTAIVMKVEDFVG